MAILSLRYGFFARLGAATVINEEQSRLNRERIENLRQFHRIFKSNLTLLSQFFPRNGGDPGGEFEIYSDNFTRGQENLERVLSSSGRYSVVVHNVKDDLLSERVLNQEITVVNRRMYERCRKLELQVFSLTDDIFPLATAILEGQGQNLPFYLMDNAKTSSTKIARRLNAIP